MAKSTRGRVKKHDRRIPYGSLKKLAKDLGIDRISADVYPEIEKKVIAMLKKANALRIHRNSKTLKKKDLELIK